MYYVKQHTMPLKSPRIINVAFFHHKTLNALAYFVHSIFFNQFCRGFSIFHNAWLDSKTPHEIGTRASRARRASSVLKSYKDSFCFWMRLFRLIVVHVFQGAWPYLKSNQVVCF